MADESDPRRDALHTFMQEQGPPEGIPDGALLTGWACVAEWMDPEGDRHLSRGWSASLPKWTAHGMMHEVLYGPWPDGEDDS